MIVNEFEQIEMMNDPHCTNILKSKTITKFKEGQHSGPEIGLKNEEKYLLNLNNDVKNYHRALKEANNDNKEKLLWDIENCILLKKYKNMCPSEIKSSITHSITNIFDKTNIMKSKIYKTTNKFKQIKDNFNKNQDNEINYLNKKAKQIMSKVVDMDKKNALIDLKYRKINEIINCIEPNFIVYDTFIEQLQKDLATIAKNTMKEIEVETYFKKNLVECNQSFINDKTINEKKVNYDIFHSDQLNSIIDSLEQNRMKFMKENPITEIEKYFYSQLVSSIENDQDLISNEDSSNDNKLSLISKKSNWFEKIIQFGMLSLFNEEDKIVLLEKLKNSNDSSTIDYEYPENILDFITSGKTVPTKDKLAVNYVLNNLNKNTIKDTIQYIERNKYNLIKLNEMKAVRKILWNLLTNKNIKIQETANYLQHLTNQEIEFKKQENTLKSFIAELHNKITDLKDTDYYYLKLLNKIYFSINNVNKILNKIKFSEDDIKRYASLTLQDKILGQNKEIVIFLQELKSMVNETDGKIRWCNILIQDHFDFDQLNLARAIYEFAIQTHIQKEMAQNKKKLDTPNKKLHVNISKESNVVFTREELKTQAKHIVKYYKEKDLDKSKNKRKPISFRKSFI